MLGIPEGVTPIALLPLAFSTGGDFASVPRRLAEEVTYFDNWGHTWEFRDDDQTRSITEGPGVTVEIDVNAPPERVWALVSDISISAQFSEEFQGAVWAESFDGPALGAQFIGTNKHPKIGEWQTTSTITELVENSVSVGRLEQLRPTQQLVGGGKLMSYTATVVAFVHSPPRTRSLDRLLQ